MYTIDVGIRLLMLNSKQNKVQKRTMSVMHKHGETIMKTTKRTSLLGLVGMLALVGCSTAPTDPSNNPNTNTPKNIKHILDVGGRIDLSKAGAVAVKVSVAGKSVTPDANGNYRILDTVFVSGAAGRVLASDSVDDTVRIIVAKDTIREIPINSWSSVLPTNYVVQRNIGAQVPPQWAGSKLEAVWWTNDSIASVITLGQGTSTTKYSGYIYSVYDDSMYAASSHLYWLFVRAKNTKDSLLAYTNTTDVNARVGDLSYDTTQFVVNKSYRTLGWSLVPADSSVSYYAKTRTVIMHLDSTVRLDTVVLDSAYTYDKNAQKVYVPDSNAYNYTKIDDSLYVRSIFYEIHENLLRDTTINYSSDNDTLKYTRTLSIFNSTFNAYSDVQPRSWMFSYASTQTTMKPLLGVAVGSNTFNIPAEQNWTIRMTGHSKTTGTFFFALLTQADHIVTRLIYKTTIIYYKR